MFIKYPQVLAMIVFVISITASNTVYGDTEVSSLNDQQLQRLEQRVIKDIRDFRTSDSFVSSSEGALHKQRVLMLRYVRILKEQGKRRELVKTRTPLLKPTAIPEGLSEAEKERYRKRYALLKAKRKYLNSLGALTGQERSTAVKQWRQQKRADFEEMFNDLKLSKGSQASPPSLVADDYTKVLLSQLGDASDGERNQILSQVRVHQRSLKQKNSNVIHYDKSRKSDI